MKTEVINKVHYKEFNHEKNTVRAYINNESEKKNVYENLSSILERIDRENYIASKEKEIRKIS